ncbi:DNA methylase [Streptomyces phage Abt2graduatex2]|nr:DNA methylase [Streptomyces phage Abt2graduatex2]
MTKMVGLFAGPGGICWGGELVGVKSVGIEWDANACATRRAAGLETVQGDVRQYGPSDFPGCDTLTAGPPCQTFTLTGNGKGRRDLSEVLHIAARMIQGKSVDWMLSDLEDERTGLVLEPLRWALEAHRNGTPYRTIVLEQVPTVLPVWEAFATYLTGLGYSVATGVLRTERYGVPQTRKRAVLVASLDRFAQLPVATHLPYAKNGINDCVTMNEVLDRPEPFTVISNYGTGGDASKRGQRTSDEPAFTVTGKVSRNRVVALDGTELPRFTHAEAGALQSFPHSYPWSGKDIPQQIGNAVPPLFAAAVLRAALGL